MFSTSLNKKKSKISHRKPLIRCYQCTFCNYDEKKSLFFSFNLFKTWHPSLKPLLLLHTSFFYLWPLPCLCVCVSPAWTWWRWLAGVREHVDDTTAPLSVLVFSCKASIMCYVTLVCCRLANCHLHLGRNGPPPPSLSLYLSLCLTHTHAPPYCITFLPQQLCFDGCSNRLLFGYWLFAE